MKNFISILKEDSVIEENFQTDRDRSKAMEKETRDGLKQHIESRLKDKNNKLNYTFTLDGKDITEEEWLKLPSDSNWDYKTTYKDQKAEDKLQAKMAKVKAAIDNYDPSKDTKLNRKINSFIDEIVSLFPI